jgi:hypothetical protein
MFILTPLYGRGMVFYSVLHTWPGPAVLAFFASWISYYAFALFIATAATARLVEGRLGGREERKIHRMTRSRAALRWLGGPPDQSWSIVVYLVAALTLFHFMAALTYENWSAALF